MSIFVIDTNVFITAYQQKYAFNICPVFWDAIITHKPSGRVRSIERVRDELNAREDNLSQWMEEHLTPPFFQDDELDPQVEKNHQAVIEKITQLRQYEPTAILAFGESTDSWLIAYAKTYAATVITLEKSRPEATTEVKIPDACREFRVECENTFYMLEELGIEFTLPQP